MPSVSLTTQPSCAGVRVTSQFAGTLASGAAAFPFPLTSLGGMLSSPAELLLPQATAASEERTKTDVNSFDVFMPLHRRRVKTSC
jgi:hypothetical protein